MAKSIDGIIKGLAIAAAALALAACETTGPSGPAPENRVGGSVSTPTNAPETAYAPSARQVEPDYIPSTDELVGFGEARTEDVFGAPSLRRVDQDAQIWQYRTETCVLFLFFYPDDTDTARVSYVTSSGAHSGQVSPGDQACVDAVTRQAVNASAVTG